MDHTNGSTSGSSGSGSGGQQHHCRQEHRAHDVDVADNDDDAYLAQVADEMAATNGEGEVDGDDGRHRYDRYRSPGDDAEGPLPDFTPRAVIAGLLVGVLLAFTNLYFGLQTGWISMMSLQSALLGYAIFKLPTGGDFIGRLLPKGVVRWLGSDGRPFSPQENVVLQTTAVATGTLPLAAGLVGIVPALAQLSPTLDGRSPINLSYAQLVGWSLGICFFGVFLASPLRRQVIVKERLVFPSGTATAQLIALLHGLPAVEVPKPRDLGALAAAARGGGAHEEDGRHYAAISQRASTSFEEDQVDADERRALQPNTSRMGRAIKDGVAEGANGEQDREEMGEKGWSVLGWSFGASAGLTLLSIFFPVIFALPVFDLVGGLFGVHLAADWLWWFSPSLSYVGQGIIMGFPTTLSMTAGMVCGWAILSPMAKHRGWAPGPVSSSTDGSRGWILWVALAIMIAESVISLVPIVLSYARKLRRSTTLRRPSYLQENRSRASSRKSSRLSTIDEEDLDSQSLDETASIAASDASEEELEPPSRLVPTSWVLSGLAASAVLGVGLVWKIFGADGIHPWATAVGLVLASILSLLGVRALGETDLNPVSGIGKISQLLFAVLQPGNVVANIIAGGVAEAGAQQAGDLMQDLKTGALLGASPRSQFYGQMIGSLASVFVSSAAYKLYTRVYTIPGPEFRVPTAAIWLNLARLLNTGELPPRAAHFMVIFGAIFGLLSAAKYILPLMPSSKASTTGWLRYLPSGIAFAIGFLNTPSFSLARLIGGYVAYRTSRRTGGQTPLLVIVCASGFVLGEGVISVVGLVMASAGLGAVSCVGCRVGGGGYCAGGC